MTVEGTATSAFVFKTIADPFAGTASAAPGMLKNGGFEKPGVPSGGFYREIFAPHTAGAWQVTSGSNATFLPVRVS